MTTSTKEDWNGEAKGDNTEDTARVDAPRISSVEGHVLNVTFLVEHTLAAAQYNSHCAHIVMNKRLTLKRCLCFDTLPASGDSNLGKDLSPSVVIIAPGFSDTSFSPKHNITLDSLESSSSEGEDSSYGPPSYNPLSTILEEPELEEQLEMEDMAELNLDKLRGHTEEEPAPLLLEKLTIDDSALSTGAGHSRNDWV
ncbi:hypothetical protein HPB50_009277 [Hyalomma asiaticum]|uniref:Uncharacterized protein n=1 Tax=Hyalomma asiaticum TaxID=266040 RepID=A0ACB7TF57_HYAAI|nr:hypothetical protein HPB50_009277 [Hyalomma asiaticum]